jgi:hypothetical protein
VPAEPLFPWVNGVRWVAPGFAALLFSLVLLGRNPQGLTQLMSGPPISMVATVALSQPHLASYYAGSDHSGYNAPATTFEWTNGSSSLTTPTLDTNRLRP